MKASVWICMAVLLISAQSKAADEMPLVGMDSLNRPFSRLMPGRDYLARIGSILHSTHGAMQPILLREAKSPAEDSPAKKWKLRTVAVGVGGGAKIGFGPVFGIEAQPRFRLVYTNSVNPVFPD